MKKIPCVGEVMIPFPMTIGKEQSLTVAQQLMNEHQIRHLPVQTGGRLVGIVSERDLHLAMGVNSEANGLSVADIMTEDPYFVSTTAPLDDVAGTMAENKYGCAVVTDDSGKVLGVFSAVDGLNLLKGLLRK